MHMEICTISKIIIIIIIIVIIIIIINQNKQKKPHTFPAKNSFTPFLKLAIVVA